MAGRGFASMDPNKRRAISSAGGKAAHAAGTAHKWTSDEASAAGRKGGVAPHVSRGGVRKALSVPVDYDDAPATERAPRTMPPVVIVNDEPTELDVAMRGTGT